MNNFVKAWALVTLPAAAIVSIIDAALLQRSRGYFTGGFLAVDVLGSLAETIAFLALSLVVDIATIGILVAAAIWLLSRLAFTRRAVLVGAVVAGTVPLIAANVVSYQLTRYLGTGFDVGLMFDLAGRSVAEMLAVSSSEVLSFVIALLVVGAAAGACIWFANRAAGPRAAPLPLRVLSLPVLVVVVAMFALWMGVSASAALENGLLRKPSGRALAFVVNAATDLDRDGYGALSRPSDPDPRDATVLPFAPDVPGNGIDEDGIAGDLPPGAEHYPERAVTPDGWRRTPDVVFVLLEGYRADIVGAQLHGRPITPNLSAIGARGVLSTRAFSHNGYTVQSRFHILAGTMAAAPGSRTLIDDFKANGYAVGYFSGQDESFGAAAYRVGFDRADVAFDARRDRSRRYSTFDTPGSLAVPYSVVQERVAEFLSSRASSAQPLFLYVNFEDTHFPYAHDGIVNIVSDVRLPRDEIAPEAHDALWATYVNTAANIDRAVGEVIARVRDVRGREPAIVITSDHGESLFENGFLGHGYALDDVQTRVPLIAANLPLRVHEPFPHVDLRSAIGDALRVPPEGPDDATREPGDREVFQYLGDVRRPRAIGLLSVDRRFTYDFRSGVVTTWDGRAVREAQLSGVDRATFVRLVHYWEAMNQRRRGPAEGQ